MTATLELTARELSDAELDQVVGGFLPIVAGAVVGAAIGAGLLAGAFTVADMIPTARAGNASSKPWGFRCGIGGGDACHCRRAAGTFFRPNRCWGGPPMQRRTTPAPSPWPGAL